MVWCLECPISTLNQNLKHFIINLTLISGLLTEATSAGGAILRRSNRIIRKELGAGIVISSRNLTPRVLTASKLQYATSAVFKQWFVVRLAQDRQLTGSYEDGNEPSASVICREFLY
jgi:hypothetical protein